jgi:UDPglucose 6-dehydrogenase/GDP-mannose 6-dehydrogenase
MRKRIAVVGTGYVGLVTGVCLASRGHFVRCVDAVSERVEAVTNCRAPFYEPGLADLLKAERAGGRLSATADLDGAVASSEITFITVGSPENQEGIELSYVRDAARQVGAALRRVPDYHVVAVKSTVVPGTTEWLIRQELEENSGSRAGEFGLCMNPEFLREGCAIDDFLAPDRVVIGQWDERSGQTLAEVYQPFDCPKIFTTLANAEMMKYTSNALLATLISFSNEIAALCEATPHTDVAAVLQGVKLDRRLSPVVDGQRIAPGILSFLWAGCGFGGSCLPKDVNALRAFARKRNLSPHLLDAVMEVNATRPAALVRLAERAIGCLRGAKVAVLGLAFKAGTDDLRESTALAAVKLLIDRGAIISAYDPIVKALPRMAGFDNLMSISATPDEALSGADAALITMASPAFAAWDWVQLCALMRQPVLVDGRGALPKLGQLPGVRYVTIGRMRNSNSVIEMKSPE